MIVQIYEIQEPGEAAAMIALGVDHVGSVVVSESDWRDRSLYDTVRTVQAAGAKSSLIPLFHDTDAVCAVLDYYQPDIVHFCDLLTDAAASSRVRLQERVRERFPGIETMRSIPIAPAGHADARAVLDLADRFEPVSDWFLIDTLSIGAGSGNPSDQPVEGFVGITGNPCDWDAAALLVRHSRIPVILAGGLAPENVGEGIARVGPAGVDSCTRTNAVDAQGRPVRFRKDPERVRAFVDEARRAQGTGVRSRIGNFARVPGGRTHQTAGIAPHVEDSN